MVTNVCFGKFHNITNTNDLPLGSCLAVGLLGAGVFNPTSLLST